MTRYFTDEHEWIDVDGTSATVGITDYAQDLLDALQHMPGWPDRVRTMQANWIGRSEGVNVGFPYSLGGEARVLRAFTTRADTIMGVTFCAVAPEHPLALHAAQGNPAVAAFLEECKTGGTTEAELATLEKKGVPTGLIVEHPLTKAYCEFSVKPPADFQSLYDMLRLTTLGMRSNGGM